MRGTLAGAMRVPPPLVAATAALAQRALTRGAAPPTALRGALAGVLAIGSIGLSGAAVRQFSRYGTTVDPLEPADASVLVTTGVNALTRNPMYVGLAGLLISHAVWRGSWRALVPVAGFVGVIDRVQVAAEELALVDRFGTAYDTYRADVPRWVDRRSVRPGADQG